MNVIGIEQRRTYTVVGLQEADLLPQLLSDGQRTCIPNIVVEEDDRWASTAAAAWPLSWRQAAWNDTQSASFWCRLQQHVADYLGVGPALPGYQVVLVSGVSERATLLEPLQAGRFGNVQWLDPPRAGLARWLTRQPPTDGPASTVLVVTVGDHSAECAAFVVRLGAVAAIERASPTYELLNTGVAYWTQAIVDEVRAAIAGEVDSSEHFALWQTAAEFGERLRRAPVDSIVPWYGPLEERFHSAIGIRPETVQAWESMATLTTQLPRRMHQALADIGAVRADVFLLAGAGATWPIPFLPEHAWPAPLWHEDARADLAFGAALWPRIRESKSAVSYHPPTVPTAWPALPTVAPLDELVVETPPVLDELPDTEFDKLYTKHLNEQGDAP